MLGLPSFRAARRLRVVLTILVKYGFGEFVEKLGLPCRKPVCVVRRGRGQDVWTRIRLVIEALGPTAIKIGQAVSTRPDLIPPELSQALTNLQEDVYQERYEDVVAVAEASLERPLDEIFAEFAREPVAAASLSQVHRAQLRQGGEIVAVKVRRPHIMRTILADLDLLDYLAGTAHQNVPSLRKDKLPELAAEARKTILRELDFRNEARNIIHFRAITGIDGKAREGRSDASEALWNIWRDVWLGEGQAAGERAGADSRSDSRPDSRPGVGPDHGSDVGPNVGPNAGPDARPNAGPDAGPGAGPGAGSNVGPNAGRGVGPDARRDAHAREGSAAGNVATPGGQRRETAGSLDDESAIHSVIHAPAVYPRLCTEEVLVMEFVDGVRVDRFTGDARRRKRLAESGLRGVAEQMLRHGFFHADPHFGNIRVMTDARGNDRLCFFDWGMVGRLTPDMRSALVDYIMAIVDRDAAKVARVALDMAVKVPPLLDFQRFQTDVMFVLEKVWAPLEESANLGRFLLDLTTLCRAWDVHLRSDYVLMARALINIEGAGRVISPGFDIVEGLRPIATEFEFRRRTLLFSDKPLLGDVEENIRTLARLPGHVSRLMRLAEDGELKTVVGVENMRELVSSLTVTGKWLASGLITGALIIGSSIVFISDIGPHWGGLPVYGLTGFTLSGVFGVALVFHMLFTKR